MVDRKLRTLERTFRESGALNDEVAWLTERMRVGELSPCRVELAALMLNPAAKRVLGDDHALVRWVETVGLWNFERWLGKLSEWGLLPVVRAVIAAGRTATRADDPAPVLDTLAAAEAWVLNPCAESLEALCAAGERVRSGGFRETRARNLTLMAAGLADALREGKAPTRPALLASEANDVVETRLAMYDEVSRWTLGYGDPVAERVAKRGLAS